MIKIIISNHNNKITKVSIKGHANYDEYNKDIVCAAVSTMGMTTINNIISLDKDFKYEQKDNEIVLYNNSDISDKLINTMLMMLDDLASKYNKNINIRKEEI